MSSFNTLVAALRRGDVVNNIRGQSPTETLSAFVKTLRLPVSLDRKALAKALEERESLATTALGFGFAIPHPRKRVMEGEERAIVGIAYLEHPVEWGDPEGKPVGVLFLVLSGGEDQHLSLLSEIASLAENLEFRKFIAGNPQKEEILAYLSASA
ncbi:MAG: PTS system nitrogen regulatory IIA component [Spirochaetes bacterium]|nr:MAG: PTS system nitrogen regulatory IIA component [Spirochaetota bacterium]